MKDWFEYNKYKIIVIGIIAIIGYFILSFYHGYATEEIEIIVYNATGTEIKHFESATHINICDGSVWFECNGKHYEYTNCFVEFIEKDK